MLGFRYRKYLLEGRFSQKEGAFQSPCMLLKTRDGWVKVQKMTGHPIYLCHAFCDGVKTNMKAKGKDVLNTLHVWMPSSGWRVLSRWNFLWRQTWKVCSCIWSSCVPLCLVAQGILSNEKTQWLSFLAQIIKYVCLELVQVVRCSTMRIIMLVLGHPPEHKNPIHSCVTEAGFSQHISSRLLQEVHGHGRF